MSGVSFRVPPLEVEPSNEWRLLLVLEDGLRPEFYRDGGARVWPAFEALSELLLGLSIDGRVINGTVVEGRRVGQNENAWRVEVRRWLGDYEAVNS